jgi:hypothetical protein
MKYREELKIDLYKLDEEWLDQPNKVERWTTRHAEAEAIRDRLEQRIGVVKALVEEDVRKKPAKYGWGDSSRHPTEPFISSQVTKSRKVQKAQRDFIEAKKNAKILAGAVRSFEHRKRALEKLYDMWCRQYYARPYIAKDAQSSIMFPVPTTDGVLEEQNRKAQVRALQSNPRLLVKHCSVCGKPQRHTPSGIVCEEGHGGAESIEDGSD